MENAPSRKDRAAMIAAIREVLALLRTWLTAPEQAGLRRDIITWLCRVMLPRNLPEVEIPEIIELQEMDEMLYEAVQSWYEEAEQKGLQQGLQQGQADMLLHLLELRFGLLDDDFKQHIYHLTPDAIRQCSDRLLTANTLNEVLGKELH